MTSQFYQDAPRRTNSEGDGVAILPPWVVNRLLNRRYAVPHRVVESQFR